METVTASTVVRAPRERVFRFLLDFPGYADYSTLLRAVAVDGDGGVGTDYHLHFAWWKLTYTATSRVTAIEPPERIDWRVVRDVRARGHWALEPVDVAEPVDDSTTDPRTAVDLVVTFDPDSADPDALDLPRLVSMDFVVDRVSGLVEREATRVAERVVADLEGERRDVTVDLDVE